MTKLGVNLTPIDNMFVMSSSSFMLDCNRCPGAGDSETRCVQWTTKQVAVLFFASNNNLRNLAFASSQHKNNLTSTDSNLSGVHPTIPPQGLSLTQHSSCIKDRRQREIETETQTEPQAHDYITKTNSKNDNCDV